MTGGCYRFQNFALYPDDRRLLRDGQPVDINARYLDALTLMVREAGRLITKDRFIEDVWRGVAVTDEALTQCIRSLRKHLGDDAARPRLIETVVKHGYRFIAPVEWHDEAAATKTSGRLSSPFWPEVIRLTVAGSAGAGLAGLCGGLIYGFAASAASADTGMGAISIVFVVMCLTVFIAVLGGAGVSAGIAVARLRSDHPAMMIVGGMAGGLIIGAVVKLIGLDAFNLLFGQVPGDITGAPEGIGLGAGVGLGAALACVYSNRSRATRCIMAALSGAIAGAAIPLLGGRLMAGSLALLEAELPQSRLRLDVISGGLGEPGFGLISRVVTGGIEGALFSGFIIAAMIAANAEIMSRKPA